MNIDLCFVPASHEAARKLPAVSGSSGRLVVEREAGEAGEKVWPGRVFEQAELTYTEAMLAFVKASRAAEATTSKVEAAANEHPPDEKVAKRQLRQEVEALRHHRRQLRQQRQTEDAAWRALQVEHKQQSSISQADKASQRTMTFWWYRLCQQRKQTLARRQQEDGHWRQQRQALCQRDATLPIETAWIAILVITDNCTRQCLGLPLFLAGAHVTADMVVNALQALLPPELLFLISDRGTHFTADVFRALARSEEFIHVLIARHRPQSNGIAERFVRSLKAWLRDKSWADDGELATWLQSFLAEYNDRPHQGLAIPGLSPNEFANRIWLM